jgi:hypothetical protein
MCETITMSKLLDVNIFVSKKYVKNREVCLLIKTKVNYGGIN